MREREYICSDVREREMTTEGKEGESEVDIVLSERSHVLES